MLSSNAMDNQSFYKVHEMRQSLKVPLPKV